MKTTATPKKSTGNDLGGVSLKVSVFLITLAASLIPLSLFGYVSYKQTNEQVVKTAYDSLLKSNQSNAKLVKTWLDGNEAAIRALSVNADMVSMDLDKSKNLLVKVNEQLPAFYTINLMDLNGMQVTRSSPDKLINVADRGYFKKSAAGSSAIESGISRANNKAFIAFSSPVKSDGLIVGVVAALAVAEPLTDQVTGGRIGRTGISYLVESESGVILAHPDLKLVGKKLEGDDLTRLRDRVLGKVVDDLNPAKEMVKSTSSVVGSALTLVSEINTDEINDPIRAAQKNAFSFIAIAFVLSSLLSFFLARNISLGITRLASVINAISQARTSIEISRLEREISTIGGSNELRVIGNAVHRLTASIKLAINSI